MVSICHEFTDSDSWTHAAEPKEERLLPSMVMPFNSGDTVDTSLLQIVDPI